MSRSSAAVPTTPVEKPPLGGRLQILRTKSSPLAALRWIVAGCLILQGLVGTIKEPALARPAASEDSSLTAAVAESMRGNYGEAIRHYTALIGSDKPSEKNIERAHIGRGIAYSGMQQYDAAISDFSAAIRLNPANAEAYFDRGLVYRQTGANEAAIADYTKAIRLSPNYAEAYNNRGYILAMKAQIDAAFHDFEKAISLDPRLADAYSNRGAVYNIRGNFDRAIIDFKIALRIDPKHVKARSNRAIAYFAKGEFTTSVYDFLRAAELDPKNQYRFLWLRLAQYRAGANSATLNESNLSPPVTSEWPAPLLALYSAREAQPTDLAVDPRGAAPPEHSRDCDMAFFVGEFRLMHGQPENGMGLLRRAIEVCPVFTDENIAARAEVGRPKN